MFHAVEHAFAVIGCVTVAILATVGFLVAIGVVKLDGSAVTVERHDEEDGDP